AAADAGGMVRHLCAVGWTQTAGCSDGSVPVECGQPDRCQGQGIGPGALSYRAAEAVLSRTLRLEGPGHAGARRLRAGPARARRGAHGPGGSVPAAGRRHVVLRPWRQRLPEARPGGADYGNGFRTRPYRDHRYGRLCRPGAFLPDLASRPAGRAWGESARAAGAAAAHFGGGAGMMADHGGDRPAVGGPVPHIPVMLAEVMEALALAPGALVIDGTFGAGGYTRAMLEAGARVIAIDRDPSAIAAGRALEASFGGRLRLVEDGFSRLDRHSDAPVDAVVLDVGVSSMQLDRAERGFSFRQDGPLDMRMGRDGPDAAHVVNHYKVGDLTRLIGMLGEERHAGR